jgi:hypothetical protein
VFGVVTVLLVLALVVVASGILIMYLDGTDDVKIEVTIGMADAVFVLVLEAAAVVVVP